MHVTGLDSILRSKKANPSYEDFNFYFLNLRNVVREDVALITVWIPCVACGYVHFSLPLLNCFGMEEGY